MTPGYSELVITLQDTGALSFKECGAEIILAPTKNMAEFLLGWAVDRLGIEEASRILARRSNHVEG